jgi:hypothetical protein
LDADASNLRAFESGVFRHGFVLGKVKHAFKISADF